MTSHRRVALITGSSSGIGRGIAYSLARANCDVVIHGVEPLQKIQDVAHGISAETGVRTFAVQADLRNAAEVTQLVIAATAQLGAPEILVNNAGIQHVALIEDFPISKWNEIIDIHLTASFLMIQSVLPKMKQMGRGRIINVASAHGLVASAQKSAYVAAKHGLIGLTKVVALETAKTGVTCNAICPGWVKTPLVLQQIEDRALKEDISLTEATEKLLGEKQPTQRFTEVDEIGDLVAFLCGSSAGNMTGATLSMDGGWTAQ